MFCGRNSVASMRIKSLCSSVCTIVFVGSKCIIIRPTGSSFSGFLVIFHLTLKNLGVIILIIFEPACIIFDILIQRKKKYLKCMSLILSFYISIFEQSSFPLFLSVYIMTFHDFHEFNSLFFRWDKTENFLHVEWCLAISLLNTFQQRSTYIWLK